MERPRVLLLHGFLSGRAVWDRLVGEMEGGVDCLVPDLPGYGRRKGWRGEYSIEGLVEELRPVVEEHAPVVVVGHSMGGLVALGLASRLPGMIAAAGVVGLPVFADRRDGLAYLGRRGKVITTFVSRDGPAHAACRVAHMARPLWLPWAARRFGTLPRAALACTFDHDVRGHAGGLANLVFGGEAASLASAARVPVRALHGTADRAAPLPRVVALAESQGWPLRVVPGANHQVIVEQPRLVGEWVLGEVVPAARAGASAS